MNEKRLLAAIRRRVPFRVAKRLLTLAGYPISTSWEKIEQKLPSAGRRQPDMLESLYRESLYCSEKSVAAYDVTKEDMQELRDKSREHEFEESSQFVTHYPLPAPNAALAGTLLAKPVPTAFERVRGASILIFSAVRELEFREELGTLDLTENAASRYQQVIGIRVERRQTYDAVVVPDTGTRLYVLVDNQSDTNREARDIAHFSTRTALNEFMGRQVISGPVNLFPLIPALYSGEDGTVTLLSYATTTSSVKSEKMRGSGKCLRQELFHKNGMEAIAGKINPYEIGIEWDLPEIGKYTPHPEIVISGSYRMTYEPSATIGNAAINGCAIHSELEFALDKLNSYL